MQTNNKVLQRTSQDVGERNQRYIPLKSARQGAHPQRH